MAELSESDKATLGEYVGKFAGYFDCDDGEILKHKLIKMFPLWLRPYGRLYAY